MRSFWKFTVAVFLACTLSCMVRAQVIGADISDLGKCEQDGVNFKEAGETKDVLLILREHRFNWVRLRVAHDPAASQDKLPYDLNYTITLAKRSRAMGFHILLDLYYTDASADSGHQPIPEAWKKLKHKELVQQVFAYTKDVISQFAQAGVMPNMVQIGNQITWGILWPDGSSQDWYKFSDLLKAGIDGVDAGRGPLPRPLILLHVDKTDDNSVISGFLDNAIAHHVPFDVIGLSYYPSWQWSRLASMRNTLHDLALQYRHPIVIVETAFRYTPGSEINKKPEFEESPDGQKAFLIALNQVLRSIPNGLGAGFFWSKAVAEGWDEPWGFFDQDGNALPVVSVFDPAFAVQNSSLHADPAPPPPPVNHIQVGGDISEIPVEEQNGTVYHNANGTAADPMELAQQYGWTVARIRLFVNPTMTGVEVNTLSYAVAQAQSAKSHGMKVLLDIHYSDNWDNPGYHNTPAAWQGQTYSQLQTTVQNYTATVMETFQKAGALPDYVQIGNEIGDGFLWPTGGQILFNSNGTVQNPVLYSQFIGLIKAGVAGVKQVSSTTKIVIHIPGGLWASWCKEFFDLFNAQGVNYDIIGLSYYPNLNGSTVTDLSDITATLNEMHNRYGKQLWIVEFSYGWNWGISRGALYPNTPAGQQGVTQALIKLVASYSDGGGVVYWGGFYVDNASLGSNNWEGQALFDYPNHNMLPAFTVF